jgi:hypothetical protein
MVLDAFTAFWRAFRPEQLQKASGLGSVLSYLKSCVATTVLQVKRKLENKQIMATWEEIDVDSRLAAAGHLPTVEQAAVQNMDAERLWSAVDSCCLDEKDRIIARLSLVADLKPRSILEHYPHLFSDVTEIYTIRRNLKNRLERNETLRAWWGEEVI